MKSPLQKFIHVLTLCSLAAAACRAEVDKVVWNNADKPLPSWMRHGSFASEAMDREVGYSLYLPPGYENSSRRYPVVYFLHGHGGNEVSDAVGFSGIVDRLIKAGEVDPVICVFPNGGVSGYRDHPEDKIMVKTMIIEELIPLIDSTYRTLPRRESRVIGGYSMGGAGSLRLSLNHPELFSAAGAWAGGLRLSMEKGEGPPAITLEQLRSDAPKVRLLLIAGYEDDRAYDSQLEFLELLRLAKYPYTHRTLADVHHNLGLYYKLTGEDMVRFLLDGIASGDPGVGEKE